MGVGGGIVTIGALGTTTRTTPGAWRVATRHPDPDVAIVGAGPAGLAVAACLRRRGVPFLHYEAEDRVGASWHRYYDRLHLHTHRSTSGLPHRPWSADAPAYPSRDDVIAYLEAYARGFALQPRLATPVRSVRPARDGWTVHTDHDGARVRHVVIATGLNAVPNIPAWPEQARFRGRVLHAADYRRGAAFRGRRVLVVGFGNSGAEIALDLHEAGADPTVSVRDAANLVPQLVLGIPVERIGAVLERLPPALSDRVASGVRRWRFGDLPDHGLRLAAESPVGDVRTRGRVPAVDVGTADLVRRGHLPIRPAIGRFRADGVEFVDGRHEAYDAVVLATGYRPSAGRLFDADAEGMPPVGAGLHACGFAPSSGGMLRRIGLEARVIAARIAADRSPPPA